MEVKIMSKILQLSNAIKYCLLFALMLIPGIVGAQLNTNGGFENSAVDTVAGTDVEGWVIELGGTADAVFEIVDDTVQNGSRAMKITVNAIGSNAWDIQVVGDSIPVQQGETYHFSVWAKSSGSSQVTFTVGNYSYNEYGNVIRPSSPNVNTEWKEYAFDFTITDAVEYIRAPIHFSNAANVGDTIYIDNLRIYNPDDLLKPVVVEAESGSRGSEFDSLSAADVEYISITTDHSETSGTPSYPGANRTATYQVTFPDTGIYDLFVRLRVGDNGFDDDSFFYGNGFGEKIDSVADEWIMVNQMNEAGFTEPDAVVYEPGILANGVWKWVNVSVNQYTGEPPLQFTIGSADSLKRIFQIGARENGLDIDKFAFGKSFLRYTVENLDSVQAGSSAIPIEVWEGPPLASSQPKFVGNVYSGPQIQNFEAYWNQVTPENAGKWGSVEGTRDVMNWSGLDAAYALAKDNDFPFHFHVLVWGAQQPAWISSDTLSDEEKLEEITEWFEAVAARYDDIDYLEVVNEPLPGHNPPDGTSGRANYKEALGGNGDTGWDWVITAFQMARDIFPAETKLMINDFGILGSTSSTAQYLSLIRLLQSEDLIDIIGVQGHTFTTTAPAITMKRNLDSLATTGLPIQITEMDINESNDDVQLQNYQRIFPTLYEHPGVEGITLWGWRPGLWQEDAYLINQDNSERPALEWLRTYLDTVDVTVSIEDYSEIPLEFRLSNNYPNPFNPSTTINFDLPKNCTVKLVVYDIMGRKVTEILKSNMNAGHHKVTFNASNLSSGLYYYRFEAGEFVDVKKMMLIK
jgi:endo-1,4-beta-xylanase